MFVSEKALGRWIAAFWLSVPLAVTAAAFNPQLHTPPMLIFIGFLPAAVSLLVERLRKMPRESASAQ